jgi:hypothetical protein
MDTALLTFFAVCFAMKLLGLYVAAYACKKETMLSVRGVTHITKEVTWATTVCHSTF